MDEHDSCQVCWYILGPLYCNCSVVVEVFEKRILGIMSSWELHRLFASQVVQMPIKLVGGRHHVWVSAVVLVLER